MERDDKGGLDITALYEKYGPMVLRRCRFLLKNEEAALDAMQETFVKLLRYQDQLSGEYPSSLLYRMATNICLNLIRDRRPQTESDPAEVIARIAHYDDHENRFLASRLLDRLFADELADTRQMATLHFVDGMTLQEVADVVNLSVSGVRKRLRLFRQRVLDREVNHGP
jgi:RNA polymerase sigma-70 factor (ECF subfamily)